MCGIIAGFNSSLKNKGKQKKKTEKINQFIIDQYQDQCNRGTKGFGIIRITENGTIEIDRATQEMKFMLDLYLKPATMIIAHHRQPTSTDNKMDQTHPILISNPILKYDYYFIHNGIISNDTKLKIKHYDMGITYSTAYEKEGYYAGSPKTTKFNDSESLGVEIALLIEKKQDFVENTNNAAFITLQIDKKTNKAERVFFGRSGTGSSLNLSKFQGNIKISSEGEGEEVIAETLWSFDPKDPKMILTSKAMEFKEIKEKEKEEPITHQHTSQNMLTTGESIKKAIEENIAKTENESELITIEERKWIQNKTDETVTDIDYDEEEEAFVGKNYQAETIQAFKETIKEDDSDMVEISIESALDEQVEQVTKLVTNFQKTLQARKIDPKERGWYLSQTFQILKTMELITDIAEEDYNEKLLQEEIKAEEDRDPYSTNHMDFRAGRRVHNYKTGEMEDPREGEYMGFNRFG